VGALRALNEIAPRLGGRGAFEQHVEVVVAAMRDRRNADDEAGARERSDRPLDSRALEWPRPHSAQHRAQQDDEWHSDAQGLQAEVQAAVNEHSHETGDQRAFGQVMSALARDMPDERAESHGGGDQK